MHICMTRNGERGTQITTKKDSKFTRPNNQNFDFNKLQSGRQRRKRTGGQLDVPDIEICTVGY